MSAKPIFLYVEDDPTSRDVMEVLLVVALGYPNLIIFEDSHNFLDRVEALSPQPDIFLLDIHVKPYDGFALLEMLRQHRRYADCTVIAVTASVMNEEVIRLQQAGFDGGIAKPINQRVFPKIVEQILAGEHVWQIT